MRHPKSVGVKKIASGLVAVAIDKDKCSQYALKWAAENLVTKGSTIILIHVVHRPPSHPIGSPSNFSDAHNVATPSNQQLLDKQMKDLFLTFRCFCTRKDIHCLDVVLEDTDVVKALTEYVYQAGIENLVLGASSRSGFIRKFKTSDISSSASKAAPDFCSVYVISKGKISSQRNASRSAPSTSLLHEQIENQIKNSSNVVEARDKHSVSLKVAERASFRPRILTDDKESVKSPFNRGKGFNGRFGGEFSESDTDISFVSSGRPSTDIMSPLSYDYMDSGRTSRVSTCTDQSFGSVRFGTNMTDLSSQHDFSFISENSGMTSCSSRSMDDLESEMRRLKLELKQTMDLYSTACKEALTAKQKATELHRCRLEDERKLEEAQNAEEAALAVAEKEKAKCLEALEAVEAAQRMAGLEEKRRVNVEIKAHKDAEEMKKVLDALNEDSVRYRRYTIQEIEKATEFFTESRKIGEGGYGPVYKCYLDHTAVAVKVLRPDAAQGRSQFQQEVEVLSCIRHPNMVLLLGACPEYGCLVYEFMANGSLDDRLFRRGNTPALSWQLRFQIAAEIGTGLLFLHQTKPEPLVHRDLKPANILLDHNYVSKISDVGLARLVPPSVADEVTQCRLTSAAGTFCYIDPEYQQTGMLGVKSDVYSLGILFLQLITAKSAMGLTHHVQKSIENGTFSEMLDPDVPDWPVEEALGFAKLAIQCAELRRKDRPDLGTIVLPELNRLRELAVKNSSSPGPSPCHSYTSSTAQDVISDPALINSGYASSKSQSSISSLTGGQSSAD